MSQANNAASKSDELWTDVAKRCQITHDSEFPSSACLVNVTRVHMGPVNGSSNTMKQPLCRGRSAYLNRNVTK